MDLPSREQHRRLICTSSDLAETTVMYTELMTLSRLNHPFLQMRNGSTTGSFIFLGFDSFLETGRSLAVSYQAFPNKRHGQQDWHPPFVQDLGSLIRQRSPGGNVLNITIENVISKSSRLDRLFPKNCDMAETSKKNLVSQCSSDEYCNAISTLLRGFSYLGPQSHHDDLYYKTRPFKTKVPGSLAKIAREHQIAFDCQPNELEVTFS